METLLVSALVVSLDSTIKNSELVQVGEHFPVTKKNETTEEKAQEIGVLVKDVKQLINSLPEKQEDSNSETVRDLESSLKTSIAELENEIFETSKYP
ncbi:hypothetical protein AYI68_g496 [Smittium mucronatum]|uniref:Uncharacterized protein n=1 Tax=Smittium mucronatum TaxID=133383 RepID=A0A1R0H819_9FUNG|nr:hypothetical protein AYI68_g496 [Smittium mucronatum]